MEIYNIAGQLIDAMEFRSGMTFGENLRPGIYFLHVVIYDNKQVVIKAVKE